MKQFEQMTIGQLRELTEQYERLELENKNLKAKYPKAAKEINSKSAEELLEELE